jgi:hypothetical protein
MECGYCGRSEHQFEGAGAHLALGYLSLTGFHALGVGPACELVVLAEATTLSGSTVFLPHLCRWIPDAVREQYADEIAALARRVASR